MKFLITVTDDSADICEQYPFLKSKLQRETIIEWNHNHSAAYSYEIDFINIDNLEELLELKDKVNDHLIISLSNYSNKGTKYEIEIYNDYRE